MRSIWTGAIGFGLVSIPIKLYGATQESDLDLDMLDKKDHSRIRYQRINEQTGKEVAWENIVKGYKYEDRYIVLTDEDFVQASPEKNKTIEILDFVQQKEINALYYETPYYLEPAKGGERPYVLLREALKKSGKVGVGHFVLRNKESLCVLSPLNQVLLLNKIRFAEEIRNPHELQIPAKAQTPAAELKMAMALIDQLSGPFDIVKYKNTYGNELMKLIRQKAKGGKVPMTALKVVHNRQKDLLQQLKASLQSKRKKAS
jgi:DNA end-binding protein Ku